MPKFRKKPVVVEAEQWFPGKFTKGVGEWNGVGRIATLEGELTVSPGDWIITGIKGERYPCKPDIFESTYERVSDNYRVQPLSLDPRIWTGDERRSGRRSCNE